MIRTLVLLPVLSGMLLAGTMQGPPPQRTPKEPHRALEASRKGPANDAARTAATGKADTVASPATVSTNHTTGKLEQRAPTDPAPPSAGQPMTPAQRDALQEILRLRKMQGDIFQGTMFAGSKAERDRQFVEALQEVIRKSPAPGASALPVPRAPSAAPALDRLRHARDFQGQAGFMGSVPSNAALADTLRATAELMDAKANLLERADSYRDADRLRRLARRLRHEARRWASGHGLTDHK